MDYTVRIVPSARKALAKLPRDAQERLLTAFALLRGTPIPPSARKLTAADGLYRIRVGDYRAIYQVRDRELLVLVIKIGHRKDVYRGL